MSALKRGVMNLKRKSGRSVGVIAIIAFTLSIFLISTSVAASIEGQVGDIQEELERTVVISNSDTSFDSTAFYPEELVDNISTIDGIESIQTTIEEIDRTALEAMIAESQQSGVRPDRELMRSLIVYHNGQNVNESLVGSIGEDLTLENGRMLESDDFDKLLAVIGIQHATDNEVTIGDLVDVNGTLVEVVGIISGEATRTNQTIFMPVQAMMYAYNLQGYDEVSITMEEISYVDPAIIEIQSMTDDEIIVQSGADQEGAAISQSIDSIIANSEMSAFVSLFTAIIVISLIMIIITKERTQEIGVLKAIGLKDRKIVAQFISESISIAVF